MTERRGRVRADRMTRGLYEGCRRSRSGFAYEHDVAQRRGAVRSGQQGLSAQSQFAAGNPEARCASYRFCTAGSCQTEVKEETLEVALS